MCYTSIGLLLLIGDATGYSHLRDMSHLCVHVETQGTYLNTFPRVLMHGLSIWNHVIFSASVRNMAARVVRGSSGSTHPHWIPYSWILFAFIYK